MRLQSYIDYIIEDKKICKKRREITVKSDIIARMTDINQGEVGGLWSRTPRELGKPGGNQGRLP